MVKVFIKKIHKIGEITYIRTFKYIAKSPSNYVPVI